MRPGFSAHIIAIAVGVLAAAAHAQEGVIIVDPPLLVVDAKNTASALLQIHNPGTQPASLSLTATDFQDHSGEPLGAVVTFKPDGESAPREFVRPGKPLAPGETLFVRVEVSNLWQPGTSRAFLKNDRAVVGELKAFRRPYAFRVTPEGAAAEATQPTAIDYVAGRKNVLTLQNQDEQTYPIDWMILADGAMFSGSTTVEGNSIVTIPLNASVINEPSYPSSSFFRKHQTEGKLYLHATTTGGKTKRRLQSRTFPVTLHLSRVDPSWHPFLTSVLSVLLLIAGGVASLFVTHWVPNRVAKVAVKESLDSTTRAIRTLSGAINSSLRVGLRVERQRLLQRLGSRWTLSPDYAALAAECAADAKKLDHIVQLVGRIDGLLRRSGAEWDVTVPVSPTALARAQKLLRQAQSALDVDIDDARIVSATALIAEAEKLIIGADVNRDQLAADVAARVGDLIALTGEQEGLKQNPTIAKLLKEDRELRQALNPAYQKSAEVLANVFALDRATARLQLIAQFVTAWDKLAPQNRETMAPLAERFYRAIRNPNFGAYLEGQQLVDQLVEQVTEFDLRAAIQRRNVRISIDPRRPKVNESITFRVLVSRPEFNTATARRTIICVWDFGDSLDEKGWTVSHYYKGPGVYTVTVTFRDESETSITADGGDEKLSITETVDVKGTQRRAWGERTKIEVTRLIVVLIVTVFGLMAGAKEEIAKLDFFAALTATFLLGFSADQIKNILLPRHQ